MQGSSGTRRASPLPATQWQPMRALHFSCGILALTLFMPARLPANTLPRLLPQPREVSVQPGQFVVTPRTRIFINRRHAAEDRTAAESLVEELARAGVPAVRIVVTSRLPESSEGIFLARPGEAAWIDREVARAHLALESGPGDQGYLLLATPRHIVVLGRSGQGVFYGAQTLRQLFQSGPGGVISPAVRIRDWPAMLWRGWQDDISRGPIPTLQFLKDQVRTLAAYKINLLGLYLEDSIALASDPLVGPPGAALTLQEVQELVQYARRYYVTILPEQETFGHLHKILRMELYSSLAELPHGAVLTPAQPGSLALISRMLNELLPLFPGPFFHIGADETFELGRGQSRELAEKLGLGKLYLEFLMRVAEPVRAAGRRPIFWGDIARHYPELLAQLPKDMIADAWVYEPRPDYLAYLEPFRAAGLDVLVSPGASNWNRIFPDVDAATQNICTLLRDGQRVHALGALNTSWNDDGESLVHPTWPAALLGAACSWQPAPCAPESFWASYDWAFFRLQGHDLAGAVQHLARAVTLLREAGLGGAMNRDFWLPPLSPAGARYAAAALPVAHEFRLEAEQALETFLRTVPRLSWHAEALADLVFAARRLDALGMKVQFTAEINQLYADAYQHMADRSRVRRALHAISSTNGRLQDLREAAEALRAAYEQRWRAQYRPYWLGDVLVRYDRLALELQGNIQAIEQALEQYERTGELPPPEQLGLLPNLFPPAAPEGSAAPS